MKNYDQPGERISTTLAADVVSGDPVNIGDGLLGIALVSGSTGDNIECAVEGVFVLPKVSAAVIAQGAAVLFDSSATEVDDDAAAPASGDFLCGIAWEAAGNGVTQIAVKINRQLPSVT